MGTGKEVGVRETTTLIRWTKKEDRLLTKAIIDSMRSGVKYPQAFEIAAEIIGRTPQACQQRWGKSLYAKHKNAYVKARQEGRHKIKFGLTEELEEIATTEIPPTEASPILSIPSPLKAQVEEATSTGNPLPQAIAQALISYNEYLERSNRALQHELAQLTIQHHQTLQLLLKEHQ